MKLLYQIDLTQVASAGTLIPLDQMRRLLTSLVDRIIVD